MSMTHEEFMTRLQNMTDDELFQDAGGLISCFFILAMIHCF